MLAYGIGIPLVVGVGYATVHLRDLETPVSSCPRSTRNKFQALPVLSRGLQQNHRAFEGFTVLTPLKRGRSLGGGTPIIVRHYFQDTCGMLIGLPKHSCIQVSTFPQKPKLQPTRFKAFNGLLLSFFGQFSLNSRSARNTPNCFRGG